MYFPKSLAGLASRRKNAGYTQQSFADAFDVGRTTVAMWETGDSWPSARLLPAMADLLLCSIDDLYREEADDNAAGE